MIKRAILQVDTKIPDHTGFKRFKPVPDLYELSEKQARSFSKKWNVDYVQINDCDYLPDKHPVFQRFKIYEMDYDEILYLDMDAIILNRCPNIFDLFKEHTFSAVRNYDWDKNTEKYNNYREDACRLYNAKTNYRPFCSGVMLIKKEFLDSTKNLWRQYLNEKKYKAHDQDILNQLVVDMGGKYNELGEEWGAWYRTGKYIDHLGGPFRKFDFNVLDYIKKHNLPYDDENSLTKFFERS